MLNTVCLCISLFVLGIHAFCGDHIRWSHLLNIEDTYGMWYGVGFAQHSPDMTNKPNEIGCVTLHITDVTAEPQEDWIDWSILKHNYSDEKWRSQNSNPWSNEVISGSWLDVRVKRRVERDVSERRLRVVWDEDGQSVEQVYLYTPEEPGLWVAEQRQLLEREMSARGVDLWYPDDPPRHPQVIRILKVTPQIMIINHCSDVSGGIFSLILRRSPAKITYWQWFDYKKEFYNFELPNIQRYSTVCAGCVKTSSVIFILICFSMFLFI